MKKIEKLKIRKLQVADLKAIMHLKNAENWNQTEDDWLFLINISPEYCLVAVFENHIVGTVTAISYQNKLAWIGMMLVSRQFRGKGISKILLNTVIKELKEFETIKLDATLAGIPMYRKLGFVEEYKICRMVSSRLGNVKKNRHGVIFNLSQITENNISNIVSMDKGFFGVDRYDLFKFLLKSRKDICLQLGEYDDLKGYVLGRKGSNFIQIGPLVADSTESAKNLLSNAFEKLKGHPIVLDVILNKIELINWLLSIGFTHQRKFTRMYLKSNKYFKAIDNQYLISGPELG